MSDVLEGPGMGLSLRKIRLTPMRDLLRGRITGRLDWRARVRSVGLPAEIEAAVMDTVRRTRLWLSEKAEVAAELAAHFHDGLGAGAAPGDLVRSFGQPKRAARLIGRAKRRGRGAAWKVLNALRWAWCCILLAYAVLAAWFFIGRAHPTVDYVAKLNAATVRTPEDQRAWPLYRQAILAMRDPASKKDEFPKVLGYSRYGRHWPEIKAFLVARQADVERVRVASERPAFGFVLGPGGSIEDPALGWTFNPPPAVETDPLDRALVHTLLPYLSPIRSLADVLADDAKLAAEQHDGGRAARDVNALLSMAEQLHERQTFVLGDLVALGVRAVGVSATADALHDSPALWDDAQWVRLAHRLSGVRQASDLMTFDTERYFVPDLLQRTFTDDGRGDGRLTFAGAMALGRMSGRHEVVTNDANIAVVAGPGLMAVSASRQELLRAYDAYLDEAEASLHVPLREAPPAVAARERWFASPLARVRYGPLIACAPSISTLRVDAERYLGRQEGLVAAISLELYRRHHGGQYPATLDVLVPQWLPTVPADRITGEPVRYRVVNGEPRVYSVGADRKDDGGEAEEKARDVARWDVPAGAAPKGDWVLYPERREVPRDE